MLKGNGLSVLPTLVPESEQKELQRVVTDLHRGHEGVASANSEVHLSVRRRAHCPAEQAV